ncbi:ribosome biogenesis GTPase Der [Pseudoramibacter alactolyticus ATCC 23263]|uniref:GTPase Der n=1 Tax=Pseudoramibacter alactolyticus ATCC 23263 TaxID=887929 RepID=E6MFF1_9FIRM|nr:ribosome biogenesis GTPase Der [Pseudoramibacter alactolyticus]EFV02311.1 ribosome biogenesis GTPase Der [Pseudoramibacter alactolyticus ATCC 23263]
MKPIVAVVGKPNVGKSTLFNKLVGERIAIVENTPGVTRDRIIADAEWQNHRFTLIDTGGIELKTGNTIMHQMRVQAEIAIETADLILLLCDGREGMTAADEDVADMLRKQHKKVIVVVNKLDSVKLEERLYEFYNLGLGDPLPISAEQGLGLGDLLDAIVDNTAALYQLADDEDGSLHIAVVGKPNAGKSTLVNQLIGENRMIVSDIPGTTRDAIDSKIERGGVEYTFIDTAGLRRKSKIADEVERYSIIRAIAAVDRADVVLMMVNAQTGVTEQDSKIAGIAHNRFIPTIIVVNKWDLIEKDTKTMQKMTGDIRNSLAFMPYAPMLFISAKTGKRAEKIYDKIQYVVTQSRKRVLTAKLNEALIDFVSLKEPPSKNGRRLKLFYGSQVDIAPPTFVIFVNDDTLMHFSYKRYLENKINETFDFDGTPFRLLIRNREKED